MSASSASSNRPAAAILCGGLLAGVLDISQAFVASGLISGARPYRVLQGVASGAFGRHSFEMGWTSILLGLCFHFTIALTAATVYFLASRWIPALTRHAVWCGLLYGEAVFFFMYFVVIPLSAIHHARFNIGTYLTGPLGHPFLVGLPIALAVRRFAPAR